MTFTVRALNPDALATAGLKVVDGRQQTTPLQTYASALCMVLPCVTP